MTRKAPGPKMNENKKRTRVPAKRRYKVRVIAQLIPPTPTPTVPENLTPTVPTPTVATTSTQMPMVNSTATSIPVMVYNLAKGKFDGVPYPTERSRLRKFLQFTTPTIHHLKLYPMPLPSNSERTPLGLAQSQPPLTYLKPRQNGQFPLHQHPQNQKCHPK